jgi:hypothetical protein
MHNNISKLNGLLNPPGIAHISTTINSCEGMRELIVGRLGGGGVVVGCWGQGEYEQGILGEKMSFFSGTRSFCMLCLFLCNIEA